MHIIFAQEVNNTENRALINEQSITSNYLNSEVRYHIYFPNTYEVESSKRFPVIYWLHGSGGWPPGALEMLAKRFDMAIKTKQIPAALVVFLDDGKRESMWVDYKDGSIKMESIIINELIPHIDHTYRTINHSKGRILEGGSMGGYGGARLGLKYPELFSAISLINPGPMQKILIPQRSPFRIDGKS